VIAHTVTGLPLWVVVVLVLLYKSGPMRSLLDGLVVIILELCRRRVGLSRLKPVSDLKPSRNTHAH